MPYAISDTTKAKLETLIGQGQGHTLGHAGVGGVRQIVHVKITGEKEDDGSYPCKATAYNVTDAAWVEYDGTAYAYEANDKDLEVDMRYMAIRYGVTDDDEYIFVTDNTWPLIKCHLEYQQDPDDYDKWKLNVTPDTLAGCGLKVEDESSSGGCDKLAVDVEALAGDGLEVTEDSTSAVPCDPLKVKEGCGILVDSDGVHVDVAELAGDGLTAQTDPDVSGYCLQFAVDPACGLRIDDDGKLALDLEAIAFDGLYGDNDICAIGVNVECGIKYVGTSAIGVDHESLAGDGLQVTQDGPSCDSDSTEDCCPQLEVKPGCGIEVDEDGVHVKPSDLVGCGLKVVDESGPGCAIEFDAEAVAGCGLTGDGCTIEIDTDEVTGPTFSCVTAVSASGCGVSVTTTAFSFKTNACGVFLGVEQVSTNTSSFSIKSACCDCSDESSDEPSSDPSSDCPPTYQYWCTTEGCVMIDDCVWPDGYSILSGPHPLDDCGVCTDDSSDPSIDISSDISDPDPVFGWSCVYNEAKVGGAGYECVYIEGGTHATEGECLAVCDDLSVSEPESSAVVVLTIPQPYPPLNLEM